MASTITRIRRFERGLCDGKHHSTLARRSIGDSVVFAATCTCGWESPVSIDEAHAAEAHEHHLLRAGLRVGVPTAIAV